MLLSQKLISWNQITVMHCITTFQAATNHILWWSHKRIMELKHSYYLVSHSHCNVITQYSTQMFVVILVYKTKPTVLPVI